MFPNMKTLILQLPIFDSKDNNQKKKNYKNIKLSLSQYHVLF